MPRSRCLSLKVFGTRASSSGSRGARLARIGTTIVESSGGGGGVVASVCAARVTEISVIIFENAMSDTTTRGIRIQVESEYLADRSDPSSSEYYYAYHVRISNVGNETAQLVSREWIITDG